MRIINYLSAVFIAIVISACNPESQAIVYGQDKCEFCRMSIVDQRFGGEIVTQKGKVFKYDAIECVINYLDKKVEDESKIKFILTNTYDAPGQLIDAANCYYLKSENMPSPMGMYLNPFKIADEALKSQKINSGIIYTWKELRSDFIARR